MTLNTLLLAVALVAAMWVVMLGGPDLFALFDALCYRKGANP